MNIQVIYSREYLDGARGPRLRVERSARFSSIRVAHRFIARVNASGLRRVDESGNRVLDSGARLAH